jgi:CRISPR type III-associated protein (TIGR04423 family)
MDNITISKAVGYIWMSDSQQPDIRNNELFEHSFNDNENPFIIEGLLLDQNKKVSYNIKFVDGHYLIKCYSTNNEQNDEKVTFVPDKRISGDRNLAFIRRWKSEPDEECEEMSVLLPAELIFIGFENRRK